MRECLNRFVALYGYSSAFAFGISACSFYGLAYGASFIREREDLYNYAFSGAINSGIVGSYALGPKRGILFTLLGCGAGVALKLATDFSYNGLRGLWIDHRKYIIEYSKPRALIVRKTLFPPREEATVVDPFKFSVKMKSDVKKTE